jgi:hypothetical protein
MTKLLLLALLTLAAAACADEAGAPESTASPSTGGAAMALEVSSGAPNPLSPGTYTSRVFVPAPTFTVGEGWASSVVDTRLTSLVRDVTRDADCLCVLAPDGVIDPQTGEASPLPADLTGWFATNPGLVTTNPSSLQVGNRAARQMEVTVAEGATLTDGRLPLLTAEEHVYFLAPGERGHIIVVDHPKGPVVIGVRAPADVYSDYFRHVETVVGSMTFAD